MAGISAASFMLAAAPAGATTYAAGQASCATNGTYTITYRVHPDVVGYPWHFAVLGRTPTTSQLSGYPTSGSSPSAFTVTQTGVAGSAKSAGIKIGRAHV